jgi:hypothetical protein
MARGQQRQTGRILPHQRDTNDVTPIINGGTVIDAEHAEAIQHTQAKDMEDKTRKEHRRRIRHLYTWWQHTYIDYFENGTRALSDDEMKDPVRFHHTNDRDIIYEGLNVSFVLAFLVSKKTKANGKMSSVSDISKYNDAIKWGAGVAEQRLPTEYYEKIDKFMAAYKKEHAGAKKEGNVDEREADPINASLFTLICKWAVEEMNIFVWIFSLLMWHMMARSISISSLALHNIKRGVSDSIQFKYDETKMDKSGEFVQTKNCYANPKTPYLCLYLALGCWLSINSESFETTEKLFVKSGVKDGTASQTYCRQLSEMVKRHFMEARFFLRLSHFHAHGIRKGSGTHASSATTVPPAFTSVAARGEWSMGKILDIYFQFAMGGDYYLGRLLTLIDPEDDHFDTLPPHWKDEFHPSVRRGIKITFGKVLSCHEHTDHNPLGLLAFLLASIVHHSDWLFQEMGKHPGHHFYSIPVLNDHVLLKELKEQLTLEQTDTVPAATGIPPHVSHARAISKVFNICMSNKDALDNFKADLKTAVADAVDAKVRADGGINQAIMKAQLDELLIELRSEIRAGSLNTHQLNVVAEDSIAIDTTVRNPAAFQFHYKDVKGNMRFWSVPECFKFPQEINRWNGWRKWLCGTLVVDGSCTWKIKPFRYFKRRDFKTPALQNAFSCEWKPIFSTMISSPGVEIPHRVEDITEDILRSSYTMATAHLRDNFTYIFQQPDDTVSKYTIGTWSKYIKPSHVKKHGTVEDIARLPPETNYNKPKQRKDRPEASEMNPRRKINKVAVRT